MKAYFAGGCFWCITPTFKETAGVQDVTCGYCGGDEANPTYEQVKHGETSREVHITDIAPTVCHKLHIQQPNACVGEPITEVMGE